MSIAVTSIDAEAVAPAGPADYWRRSESVSGRCLASAGCALSAEGSERTVQLAVAGLGPDGA